MQAFKIGQLVGAEWQPASNPHTFEFQRTTGPSRLAIAPHAECVSVLMELTRVLPEPFGILYVLLVSRCGHPPGRYQSPAAASRDELESFLAEFRTFFERDGRHHVWVTSFPTSATLVYDRHDCIYAYGPLAAYERVLRARGLGEGQVRLPAPHAHNYNAVFDELERRVMSYWDWQAFPLEPSDDP